MEVAHGVFTETLFYCIIVSYTQTPDDRHLMTYSVKIVETNIGYKVFETEEDARNWIECPEDFDDITWSESMIEELKLEAYS